MRVHLVWLVLARALTAVLSRVTPRSTEGFHCGSNLYITRLDEIETAKFTFHVWPADDHTAVFEARLVAARGTWRISDRVPRATYDQFLNDLRTRPRTGESDWQIIHEDRVVESGHSDFSGTLVDRQGAELHRAWMDPDGWIYKLDPNVHREW